MTTVHLTQFFTTDSPRMFDECDSLMAELLRREEGDPTVRDAAVSADSAIGVVEVEVSADGESEQDAVQAGLARILAAVTSVVPVNGSPMRVRDHVMEPVAC